MRRCCEQTMRIMRENKESLLTIIEVTYQRQAAHPYAHARRREHAESLCSTYINQCHVARMLPRSNGLTAAGVP